MKPLHALLSALAIANTPVTLRPVTAPITASPRPPPRPQAGEEKLSLLRQLAAEQTVFPYHMVHDQIVQEGQSATVVGKFDYDRVLHKDLEGEYVHSYLYGTGMSGWQYLGRHKTNSDGKIYVPVSAQPQGDYIVRMVVEGDLTAPTTGYLESRGRGGAETVLFDIDGTITLNDFEAVGEYLGTDIADNYDFAVATVNEYVARSCRSCSSPPGLTGS
ncbi:MAG: hypothetical protein R3F47_08155 [Gammaproteobacteria bacterium]